MPQPAEELDVTLNNVRALLAEPRTQLRKDLIDSLNNFGIKDIESTGNLNKVHKCLAEGDLDLLICDTVLPEGDLSDLLKSVRFGETTNNPFLIIIVLVSNPTAEALHHIMECGPDAILVKPFTATQLNDRIKDLIHNRKRFVVTSTYVGPERRKGTREDKIGLETIRVPNPLYNKTFGTENLAVTKRAAETAIVRINNQMVESHSQQATDLITELFPSLTDFNWTEQKLVKLNDLRKTAFDLNRRIAMTDYRSLGGLTVTLQRMLKNAHKWTDKEHKSDLNLLKILCDVLQRGFNKSEFPLLETYVPDAKNNGNNFIENYQDNQKEAANFVFTAEK